MKNSTKTLLIGAVAAAAIGGYVVHKKSHKGAGHHGEKEKCHGAALKGENSCKAANASHSCAGWAKTDCDPNEWQLVKKGTCAEARKNCPKEAVLRDKGQRRHGFGANHKKKAHKKH